MYVFLSSMWVVNEMERHKLEDWCFKLNKYFDVNKRLWYYGRWELKFRQNKHKILRIISISWYERKHTKTDDVWKYLHVPLTVYENIIIFTTFWTQCDDWGYDLMFVDIRKKYSSFYNQNICKKDYHKVDWAWVY